MDYFTVPPRNIFFIGSGVAVAGAFSYMALQGPGAHTDKIVESQSPPREGISSADPSSPLSFDEILARSEKAYRVIGPVYVPTLAMKDRRQPLTEQLDQLRAMAETDASVAFDLGQAISGCANGEVGDQSLENLLDEGAVGVHVAGALLSNEEYCDGLAEEDFAYALSLLEKAAAAGLDEAQVSYVDSVGNILAARPEYRFDDQRIADFKRKSLDYLQTSARNGNHGALARMAHLYDDGGVVSAEPETAARVYREFMNRSGNNSPHHLRYLQLLERRAAEATPPGFE